MPFHLLTRITNKRELLARALRKLGVIHLLEQVALARPVLLVLTYHRIVEGGSATNLYYDPVISATPEGFEEQVRHLAGRFHVVDLPYLAHMASYGSALASTVSCKGKPLALITFDDGYQDNAQTALPILRKLGVPATFFVTSGFLSQVQLPWWDHIAYVLKQTQARRLTLERFAGDAHPILISLEPDLGLGGCAAAIMTVIRAFLQGEIPDEHWFLAELNEQGQVAVDTVRLGQDLFMNLDQLRNLLNAGMSIGSHSQTHRKLGELDETGQRTELAESKHFLESSLGIKVQALAYPFGGLNAFTETTRELAREVGYTLAFSSLEGANRPGTRDFEPLCLRRLNVGLADSAVLLRARTALCASLGRSLL
jgi:peptidoglycan/xylan/chitin deacetylase (PgdA/CDA1 family)